MVAHFQKLAQTTTRRGRYLRNMVKAILKVVVAECSYLSSYKLTSVSVAVPVKMVSTQNELKAEVGFLAMKEKM